MKRFLNADGKPILNADGKPILNADGKPILIKMVQAIQENKAYLGTQIKTIVSRRVWRSWGKSC